MFVAFRRQERGAVGTEAMWPPFFLGTWGCNRRGYTIRDRATATAKSTTLATAEFASLYGELVLMRRGLRGMSRLTFAEDLRSRYYRCAGGKELRQKARAKMQHDLQKIKLLLLLK